MKLSEGILKEIVKLSDSVPEKYQTICFELLLKSELVNFTSDKDFAPHNMDGKPSQSANSVTKLPITVKSFLTQYNLDEAKVISLFHFDGSEIAPTFKINNKSKKAGQEEMSLVLSFMNAILDSKFGFTIKQLREKCTEENIYDSANFKTYLKQSSKLYNTTEKEDILLSPDGKSNLADLLSEHIK
jgi:hypothetical protein